MSAKKGQEGMDILKKSAFWALAISLALAIILANINITVYDSQLYKKEFEKVGTYGRLGNADDLLGNILGFFRYKESLDPEFFDESQISHMEDVRQFLTALSRLFYILLALAALLIIAIYFLFTKDIIEFIRALRNSSIIILVSVAVIALLSLNFSSAFISFHEIFFPQGNYSFAASSTLIILFPSQFFQDMLFAIIFRICISATIILLASLGILYLLMEKGHKEKAHSQ